MASRQMAAAFAAFLLLCSACPGSAFFRPADASGTPEAVITATPEPIVTEEAVTSNPEPIVTEAVTFITPEPTMAEDAVVKTPEPAPMEASTTEEAVTTTSAETIVTQEGIFITPEPVVTEKAVTATPEPFTTEEAVPTTTPEPPVTEEVVFITPEPVVTEKAVTTTPEPTTTEEAVPTTTSEPTSESSIPRWYWTDAGWVFGPQDDAATPGQDMVEDAATTTPAPTTAEVADVPLPTTSAPPTTEGLGSSTPDLSLEPFSGPTYAPESEPAMEEYQATLPPVEFFPRGTTFDLQGTSLTFTPGDLGMSEYSVCKTTGGKVFPIDTYGSEALPLTDESVVKITFRNFNFPFFGKVYTSAYVASNGYVTFGDGEDASFAGADLAVLHFDKPRISGLLSDLAPDSESEVSWKETGDTVVITFRNVPQFGSPFHRNDFQIALFEDGRIGIGFVKVLSFSARVVGISAGGGLPASLQAADLSNSGRCELPSPRTPPPVASPPGNMFDDRMDSPNFGMSKPDAFTLDGGNMNMLYSWWAFWRSLAPSWSSSPSQQQPMTQQQRPVPSSGDPFYDTSRPFPFFRNRKLK